MTWTQTILDDEKNFPQKIGQSPFLSALIPPCQVLGESVLTRVRSPIPTIFHDYRQDHLASFV